MADIQYFRNSVRGLLASAYGEIGKLTSREGQDSASLYMDKDLQKNPIESDALIVKHVSIEPEDHKRVISAYEMEHKKHDLAKPTPKALIKKLSKYTSVEMMPKIDLNEKSLSFLETLHLSHMSIGELGHYWSDPLTFFGNLTDEVYYRNKALVSFPFQRTRKPQNHTAFLILAETSRN